MAETIGTQWSTAQPYIKQGVKPDWLPEDEAQRHAAGLLYDDMYSNSPDTWLSLLRGTDEKPVLVPTARRLINTVARYVGRGWGYSVRPPTVLSEDGADDAEPTAEGDELADASVMKAIEAMGALFAREGIEASFADGKRSYLRRGDWVWYLSADPAKPEGTRISVECIDSLTYFPLLDEDSRRIGAQIVEQILLDDGETVAIKVQRWLKVTHPEHPAYVDEELGEAAVRDIAYDAFAYEVEGWDDPKERKRLVSYAALEVIPGITQLPLYHIRNNHETGEVYGRSELLGLESVIAAVNQTTSDEDLAIAMAGLGMYWTDSGAPLDSSGKPTPWVLGPNRVVEVGQGKSFKRVPGVDSVEPSQSHLSYLEEQAYGSSGVNDIALGTRGAVQESGVALAIRMQPLFDAADDKDSAINTTMTQLFHDLKEWFKVYESIELGAVDIVSVTSGGDRLPFDRAQRWKELAEGFVAGILPLSFVLRKLRDDFGYDLTPDELNAAVASVTARASGADPYADRADAELDDGADA